MINVSMVSKFSDLAIPANARVLCAVRSDGLWSVTWIF